MKKIFILFTALLPWLAAAQVTPEAMLGQCPPFPTQSEIVGWMMGRKADRATVDRFMEQLEQAISQTNAAIERNLKAADFEGAAMRDADKSVRRDLGIGLDQVRNMSEADLKKLGEDKANSVLRGMGIDKSAKELGSRELSEAEKRKLAEGVAQKMTGLSLAQLEALEKMSEEEQMAYMMNSGAAAKIAANMGKMNLPAGTIQQPGASVTPFQYSEKALADMQRLRDMESDGFYQRLEDKWVTGGYQRRTAALEKQKETVPGLVVDYSKGKIHEVEAEAIRKMEEHEAAIEIKIDAIREEYCRESVKEWYPRVMQQLAMIKSILPEARQADAAAMEGFRIGGLESGLIAGNNIGAAVGCAVKYLEKARDLTRAPGPGDTLIPENYD